VTWAFWLVVVERNAPKTLPTADEIGVHSTPAAHAQGIGTTRTRPILSLT